MWVNQFRVNYQSGKKVQDTIPAGQTYIKSPFQSSAVPWTEWLALGKRLHSLVLLQILQL